MISPDQGCWQDSVRVLWRLACTLPSCQTCLRFKFPTSYKQGSGVFMVLILGLLSQVEGLKIQQQQSLKETIPQIDCGLTVRPTALILSHIRMLHPCYKFPLSSVNRGICISEIFCLMAKGSLQKFSGLSRLRQNPNFDRKLVLELPNITARARSHKYIHLHQVRLLWLSIQQGLLLLLFKVKGGAVDTVPAEQKSTF